MKKGIKKICPICNKEYITYRPNNKVCSKKKCKHKWQYNIRKERVDNESIISAS